MCSVVVSCRCVCVLVFLCLQTFPDVLGWDVDHDLLPKLHFFESLGPAGKRLLDTMYDQETGLLQVSVRRNMADTTTHDSHCVACLSAVQLSSVIGGLMSHPSIYPVHVLVCCSLTG